LVVAALLAVSTGCSGAKPLEAGDALAAWPTQEQRMRARQLYENYNVIVAHDAAWSPADIEAFEQGLGLLPDTLHENRREPIAVERVGRPCPFGIGDGTDRCPRFDESGRTFFVYDFEQEPDSPTIWRKRAAAHMVMATLDRRHGWSSDPAWTSINAWDGRDALNLAEAGYMRPLGQQSSHLDLVTFAESFFVPDDATRDIRCREFTRSHFVVEHVLGNTSTLDESGELAWLPDGGCPSFDKWARLDELESVELLLATATSDRPESLYGHLLLHLRYAPKDYVDAHGFDPVYQFGAVTDTEIESLTYVIKGIFGGFPSVMTSHTFREIERMIMLREGRSLTRFELTLTPTQRVRLLHRLREVERRDELDYKFFKRNCASFLIYALSPVFDGKLDPRMKGVFAMPTDVLDVLAEADFEGTRILRKSGADYRSHRRRTRRAARERRDALADLLAASDVPDEEIGAVLELDRQLDADQPRRRAEAYRALQQQLTESLTRWKLSSEDPANDKRIEVRLVDYLYRVTTSERYFSQVMHMRERMAAEQYAALEYPLSAEEQLARRGRLQSVDDHEQRQRLLNRWAAEQSRRMERARAAIRRDRDPEQIRAEEAQRAAYLGALELQATLMRLFSSDFDAVSHLRERREERDRLADEQAARARPDSGRNRLFLRGQMDPSADLESSIRAGFTYALISDRLGEVRQRGFRPNLESEALALSADVDTSSPIDRAFSADLLLFRYQDLTREPRLLRDSFTDALGWGTDVRLYHHGPRGQLFGGRANVGYIAPLVASASRSNILAFGVFPEANAYVGAGQQILIGGRAALRARLHLFGRYANALRMRVESAHYAGTRNWTWHQESAAHLAVDLALGRRSAQPLVVSPFGRVEWHQVTPADSEAPVVRAGLQLELPW
ncbi:MAG: DUF4105 domain-containing protein, partial [Myxococcota bacterium]